MSTLSFVLRDASRRFSDQHLRSRLRAITDRQLNPTDVESAERLARTTTRQPLTNGTRTSNQTTRQPNKIPNTGRNTSNHSRPLLPTRTQTITGVCRRQGPPWNSADGERRRTANTTSEERIQSHRTVLRQ